MVGARGVHVQAKPGHLRVGDTRSARWLNAAVHTLTHPSAKLSRPEADAYATPNSLLSCESNWFIASSGESVTSPTRMPLARS